MLFITPLSQAVSSPGASPGSPIRQDSAFFWSMVSPKGLWKLGLGDRHLFIFSGCFTEKTAAEFPKEGGSSRKKKHKKNNPETRFPNIYFNRGPGHYYTLQPWPDPQLSAAAHPSWHQHGAGHWLEEIWGFSGRAGTGQGGDCLGGGRGGPRPPYIPQGSGCGKSVPADSLGAPGAAEREFFSIWGRRDLMCFVGLREGAWGVFSPCMAVWDGLWG